MHQIKYYAMYQVLPLYLPLHPICICIVIWTEVRVTPASTLFMPRHDTTYCL